MYTYNNLHILQGAEELPRFVTKDLHKIAGLAGKGTTISQIQELVSFNGKSEEITVYQFALKVVTGQVYIVTIEETESSCNIVIGKEDGETRKERVLKTKDFRTIKNQVVNTCLYLSKEEKQELQIVRTDFDFSVPANHTLKAMEKDERNFDSLPAELKLLLYGVKPMALVSTSAWYIQYFLKNYPCVVDGKSCYVFQDAFKLCEFMKKSSYVSKRKDTGKLRISSSVEDLGIALGFPPKACKQFEEMLSLEKVGQEEEFEKTLQQMFSVKYHGGYTFSTPKDSVIDNVEWMLENRPIPAEIQTCIIITEVLERNALGTSVKKVEYLYQEFKEAYESGQL
ncbi:hypothetical protein [Bacillus thuringiensis]|uniref:hypothetical protein n=1 Tax=Bacillus thuringiensis TaxID=1428 RepID=UPI000BFCE1D8|nr:hypothetical protein [Bacillus thuringiensis]PGT89913.1 hypothetical protein COD17_09185 [Bacillus thuringiensis]